VDVGASNGLNGLPSTDPVTGSVTYLAAGIDGAPRLWQVDREAMRRAASRCLQLCSESVVRWRGIVVGERGDALVAEF